MVFESLYDDNLYQDLEFLKHQIIRNITTECTWNVTLYVLTTCYLVLNIYPACFMRDFVHVCVCVLEAQFLYKQYCAFFFFIFLSC